MRGERRGGARLGDEGRRCVGIGWFFFLGWAWRREGLFEQWAVGSPDGRPHDSGELEPQQRRGRANFSLSRKNTGSEVL